MLSEDFARKLKDAGFPQKGRTIKPQTDRDSWTEIRSAFREGRPITVPTYDMFIPTLSELIEACDDDFVSLTKIGMNHSDLWRAESSEITLHEGSTPEEAVAKIWLSQHANGDATA
jgi:hypothetical protein